MALEIRIIIGPQETAAKSYRATKEQMERNEREINIYRGRQERARRKLIEEGVLPPDEEPKKLE